MTDANTDTLDLFELFADAHLAQTITLGPLAHALAECAAALFLFAANNNLRRPRPLTYTSAEASRAGLARQTRSMRLKTAEAL